MKNSSATKWEDIRKKGKNRYLLIQGMLQWGLTTGVLWAAIMELISPTENPLVRFIIAIILFPFGGLLWATWMWSMSEKGYVKVKDKAFEQK